MSKDIIKIKLHGEGIAIRKIEIPQSISSLPDSYLYEGNNPALLDPYFYHSINSQLYESVYDLSTSFLFGLILNNKTRIEIWRNDKRVRNLTVKDLLYLNELFPTFLLEQQEIEASQEEYFYIERSIGAICIYTFTLHANSLEVINFFKTDIFGSKVVFDIAVSNLKGSIKLQKSLITNQNIQKHIT